jgi:hypothetical protein
MARTKAKRRKPLAKASRFPLRPWIVKLKKQAAPALRRQARILVDALDKAGVIDWFARYVEVRYYATKVNVSSELDRAADKKALKDKAKGILAKHRLNIDLAKIDADMFEAGSKFAFAKMGFDVAWNMDAPQAKAAIDARDNYIKGAGEAQFDKVLDTIRVAIYEQGGGAVTPDVLATIRRECATAADWQAETIARTESATITNTAQALVWRENGVARKGWTWSGVSREEHAAMDGEEVDMDEPFSNGLDHPCEDGAPPEEVICCGCSMYPVLSQSLLDDLAADGVEVG